MEVSMIFTRLGTIAAWLGMVMAAGRFAIAVYALTLPSEAASQISSRYLGTANPALVLDQAAVVFAFALALGVLVEISRAVSRKPL